MSEETEHFLKSLGGKREWRFREPCKTVDLEYYEEVVEMTEYQWEYLYRITMEKNPDFRDAYREFMTALPKPNHDYRNAVIVTIVSTLLLVGALAGALLILMQRVS